MSHTQFIQLKKKCEFSSKTKQISKEKLFITYKRKICIFFQIIYYWIKIEYVFLKIGTMKNNLKSCIRYLVENVLEKEINMHSWGKNGMYHHIIPLFSFIGIILKRIFCFWV